MRPYKLKMCRKFIKAAFLLVVLGNFGFASQVLANEVVSSNEYFGDRFDNSWPRASDSELAQLRGGFLLPNGVNIDLSIEKIISLNGVEIFSSFFQLPENGFLFQNGTGDLVSDVVNSALSSIIQNNLDNQVISTINDINLEVSNLQNLDLNDGDRVFIDQVVPNLF